MYLIDEHPPFLRGLPFPPFNPPLKKGWPPFLEGGQTCIPTKPFFLRVDWSTLEGGPPLKKIYKLKQKIIFIYK